MPAIRTKKDGSRYPLARLRTKTSRSIKYVGGNQDIVDRLSSAGGKLWERGDMRRMYFGDLEGLYGLKVEYYGTGNVASARIDGEHISNALAREYLRDIGQAKLWFDLNDNKFHWKGSSTFHSDATKIIKKIREIAHLDEENRPINVE